MSFENHRLSMPAHQASLSHLTEDTSLRDSHRDDSENPFPSHAEEGVRTPESNTAAASMMAHWGGHEPRLPAEPPPADSLAEQNPQPMEASAGPADSTEASAGPADSLDTREPVFALQQAGWNLGGNAWSQLGHPESATQHVSPATSATDQASDGQAESDHENGETTEDRGAADAKSEDDHEATDQGAAGHAASEDDAGDQSTGEDVAERAHSKTNKPSHSEQEGSKEPGEAQCGSRAAAHNEPDQHGGDALPSVMRLMELSFGEDFSNVTFSKGLPQESAGAKAAADDEHISLGSEAADLSNPGSQRILAHELAHIVQKRKGSIEPDALDAAGSHAAGLDSQPLSREGTGQPLSEEKKAKLGDREEVTHNSFARRENLEHEADAVAERVTAGESAHVAAGARAPRTQFWGWGILDKAKKAASSATSWVGGKAKQGASWVGNQARSVWNGTKQGASWVGNQAKSVWNGTKQGASWAGNQLKSLWNKTKQGASWAWNQAKSADWKKIGTGAADLATDFIPGVSNVKDAYQAITGKNPITGEKLGWGSRILSGIFAIPGVGNLAKYIGKGGKLAAKLGSKVVKLLGKGVQHAIPFLKKAGKWALGGVKKVGKWAWGGAKKLGKWAWGGIKKLGKWAWGGAKKVGSWIKDKANKLRRKVKEAYYRLTRTKASGKPNQHAKPDGKRTDIPKDADRDNRRSLTRENESADIIAQSGYKIKQNPGVKPNGKEPDYEIEGRIFDCYAPETANPRNIFQQIKKAKVDSGQADRVILNLSDSKVDLAALKKQFTDWEMKGLKEVMVIRDGKLVPFFP